MICFKYFWHHKSYYIFLVSIVINVFLWTFLFKKKLDFIFCVVDVVVVVVVCLNCNMLQWIALDCVLCILVYFCVYMVPLGGFFHYFHVLKLFWCCFHACSLDVWGFKLDEMFLMLMAIENLIITQVDFRLSLFETSL